MRVLQVFLLTCSPRLFACQCGESNTHKLTPHTHGMLFRYNSSGIFQGYKSLLLLRPPFHRLLTNLMSHLNCCIILKNVHIFSSQKLTSAALNLPQYLMHWHVVALPYIHTFGLVSYQLAAKTFALCHIFFITSRHKFDVSFQIRLSF